MSVVIPRYFVVAEATHEIQNPTSPEKLLRLGRLLGLGADSRVLDIASGRGGPALLLAGEYGCTWHGDRALARLPRGRGRADRRGGARRARDLRARRRRAGVARGGDVRRRALPRRELRLREPRGHRRRPRSRGAPGGHVVVGEPYWRRLPLPEDYEDRSEPWTTLEGTITVFESCGLPVVSVIASSEDDWDRYETLHWQAVERWLAANADDPDAADIRARHERAKRTYLRHERELPRLGDLRRLEAALGREQAPQARSGRMPPWRRYSRSRGVSSRTRRAELAVVGAHRHLARLAVLERRRSRTSSRPVSPSDSRLSPGRNWSGRTPIISRFERWMRS